MSTEIHPQCDNFTIMTRVFPARAAAVFLLACSGWSQPKGPPEVAIRTHAYIPLSTLLSAETNMVETNLIVRDRNGRPVPGLQATAFQVLDNKTPRAIVSFQELRAASPENGSAPASGGEPPSAAPAQPRFVTFFFDDLHLPNGAMQFVKKGARAFIAEGITPNDRLSIVTASGQGDLDFTTDSKLFADRLEHLSSHSRPPVPGACGVGPIDSYIVLYNLDAQIVEAAIAAATRCAGCGPDDPPPQCRSKAYAIAQSEASATWEQMRATSLDTMSALGFAAKRLAQMKGSRALVLTSSGFLLAPGIPPELQHFLDGALRSGIVVSAIGGQGLDAYMGAKAGLRASLPLMPLQNLANGTGGHFFKDSNDLAGAMKMAAHPQASYTLAFNAGDRDGKFHSIKIVALSGKGEELEYRPGYFSPEPVKEGSARSKLDDAVFADGPLREIPVVVALVGGEPKGGAIPVSVRFTVDVNALRFVAHDGRHVQQLVFVAALLDTKGGFLNGEESVMDLDLTDAKLASLRNTGLTAIATLVAPPGAYRLRAVVREGVNGHLAAIGSPVEFRVR